jgi:site-specific DNA recombinase
VPLGYDVIDKKLTINPIEADTVQTIFRRYIDLKCLRRLKEDLNARGRLSPNGGRGERAARVAVSV